jgi:hypothetical protein
MSHNHDTYELNHVHKEAKSAIKRKHAHASSIEITKIDVTKLQLEGTQHQQPAHHRNKGANADRANKTDHKQNPKGITLITELDSLIVSPTT